jgi:hypothetical protein
MESGRGHTIINEKYEYLLYEDGYTKEDTKILDNEAYNWAYNDMGGRDKMRFTSGFEIVDKPPHEWIMEELVRTQGELLKIKRKYDLLMSEV